MEKNDYIYGIRAVIEAIEAGKDIDKVLERRDLTGDLSKELLAKIHEYGVVMQRVPQEKLNRIEPSGSDSPALARLLSETGITHTFVL